MALGNEAGSLVYGLAKLVNSGDAKLSAWCDRPNECGKLVAIGPRRVRITGNPPVLKTGAFGLVGSSPTPSAILLKIAKS